MVFWFFPFLQIVASAPSGTGKTAAYLLPILEQHLSRRMALETAKVEARAADPATRWKGVPLVNLPDAELKKMGFLGKAVKRAQEEIKEKKLKEGPVQPKNPPLKPQVLVLVPTADLGEQVEGVTKQLSKGVADFEVLRLGGEDSLQEEVGENRKKTHTKER